MPEQDRKQRFEPEKAAAEKAAKNPAQVPHPKGADQEGQNIEQNTRNQGYQQDR